MYAQARHRRVVDHRRAEVLARILVAEVVRDREAQVLAARRFARIPTPSGCSIRRARPSGRELYRLASKRYDTPLPIGPVRVDGLVIGAEPSGAELDLVVPLRRIGTLGDDVDGAADGAGAVEDGRRTREHADVVHVPRVEGKGDDAAGIVDLHAVVELLDRVGAGEAAGVDDVAAAAHRRRRRDARREAPWLRSASACRGRESRRRRPRRRWPAFRAATARDGSPSESVWSG